MISQKKSDGKIHPVQVASSKMKNQDCTKYINQCEALLVVFKLDHVRINLLSDNPFVVYSDHQTVQMVIEKNDFYG